MTTRHLWALVWVLSCGPGEARLDVLLQTDYRPGIDFVEIRTELLEETSVSSRVDEGTPYLSPTDVARFELARATRRRVQVSLINDVGAVLQSSRIVSFRHDRDRQQLTRICAACADFACPLGQTCECGIEPVCVPDECEGDGCAVNGCNVDGDCGVSGVDCVALVCLEGACLRSPNDAVCEALQVCDVRAGCVTDPRGDGGLDAGLSEDAPIARVVDLNGGRSWRGWERIGEACDDRHWISGDPTRTYDLYHTRFLLDGDQTVTANRLPDLAPGNGVDIVGTSDRLFEDGWVLGDRIIGIGIVYTAATRLDGHVYLQVDYDGNTLVPASRCGAGDGVSGFDAGDTACYFPQSEGGKVYPAIQYAVFTDFSTTGGYNYITPHRGVEPLYGPSRSFVVLATDSTDEAVSGQFLLNLDAAQRINDGRGSGEGACSDRTRLGLHESGATGFSHLSLPFGGCF